MLLVASQQGTSCPWGAVHGCLRRALTLFCSSRDFHWQLAVVAPLLCSRQCKEAPRAPSAPTSSTVFPSAGQTRGVELPTAVRALAPSPTCSVQVNTPTPASQQSTSPQGSSMLLNHSNHVVKGNFFGAHGATRNTGFKLFLWDSPVSVSKYCSSGLLVFYFHKSFHSYLLVTTFDHMFTVLLHKSLSQQCWIALREAIPDPPPWTNAIFTSCNATCLYLPRQC